MKTFKQFIGEDYFTLSLEELLRRDCSDFINEIRDDDFLFRGMNNPSKGAKIHSMKTPLGEPAINFYEKKVRTERRPLNTPPHIQVLVDEWFYKKFGVQPRSSGLFCVGEPLNDFVYGPSYIIFPIGKFRYIWSPTVFDFFEDFLGDKVNVTAEEIEEFLSEQNYKMTDLDKAIDSRNEIMVLCERYYAFSITNMMQLEIALKKVRRGL